MKEDLKRPRINMEGLQQRFDKYSKSTLDHAVFDIVRSETRRFFLEKLLYEIPPELLEDSSPYEDIEIMDSGLMD